MKPTNPCPSTLALERVLLGETPAETTAHVDGCDHCRAELETRRQQGEAFMASSAATDLRGRLARGESVSTRQSQFQRVLWPALAFAAAFLLWLVSEQQSRPGMSDGAMLAAKGQAALSLWQGEAGDVAREVTAGEDQQVAPGTRIQPALSLAEPSQVALFVVDPKGVVTTLVADAGRSLYLPARAAEPLGPSFRLDAELGDYTVVACVGAEPFDTAPLGAALQRRQDPECDGAILRQTFTVNTR
jgi:hypothetical protein